ncbi:hypothetical protein TWF730_003985 [Orbilia blumenaviensis]|uniref:Uncharacterized protein n=1 Tax=Orbilia blumenaviensis TaxID=1796055 RepID=A0AAV9U1F5_9PEZI
MQQLAFLPAGTKAGSFVPLFGSLPAASVRVEVLTQVILAQFSYKSEAHLRLGQRWIEQGLFAKAAQTVPPDQQHLDVYRPNVLHLYSLGILEGGRGGLRRNRIVWAKRFPHVFQVLHKSKKQSRDS